MLKFRTISRRREKLGITQEQLQDLTGIRKESISKMENGKVPNPNLLTLEKLAKALQCHVGDLVDETKMAR